MGLAKTYNILQRNNLLYSINLNYLGTNELLYLYAVTADLLKFKIDKKIDNISYVYVLLYLFETKPLLYAYIPTT